ncbi:MAG: hypothetical protein WC676_03865 [Candidatus Omnitrophota bacterium]
MFTALLLILFWGGVLAFVPVTFYLLIKNPPLRQLETVRGRGIFIMTDESKLARGKESRVKTIGVIYAVSCALVLVWYLINRKEGSGVVPLDVFSSFSVILFYFSMLTYIPVIFYLRWCKPWQYREEGMCLTGIYHLYGVGIFAFAGFFLYSWLKQKGLVLYPQQVFYALLGAIFAAALLSYLPILAYVLVRALRSWQDRPIRPNIIFVIYSLCFVVFSIIYVFEWLYAH